MLKWGIETSRIVALYRKIQLNVIDTNSYEILVVVGRNILYNRKYVRVKWDNVEYMDEIY